MVVWDILSCAVCAWRVLRLAWRRKRPEQPMWNLLLHLLYVAVLVWGLIQVFSLGLSGRLSREVLFLWKCQVRELGV